MHSRRRLAAASLVFALAAPLWAEGPLTTSPAPQTPQIPTEVGGKKLTEWINDIDHGDPSAREEAIRAVTFFGDDASKAVPALISRLEDRDVSPRVKAVIALGLIKWSKDDAANVYAALGKRLTNDTQATVRVQAALVLLAKGKEAKPALHALALGTDDNLSWEVRKVCVEALVDAGADGKDGPDPKATRALIAVLTKPDPAADVRLEAAVALGEMGRPADNDLRDAAVLALKKATLSDRDKTVVIWSHVSAMALDKVNDDGLKYLAKHFKESESVKTRVHAIRGLGTVGPGAKDYVPNLIEQLKDKEPSVVEAACWAIGRMGQDAGDKAAAALTELSEAKEFPSKEFPNLLKDADEAARKAAAEILRQSAKDALDAIKKPKK
jgi:HEAT repeat protein